MQPSILFVHNGCNRFVLMDRNLLQERYRVTERYERKGHVNPLDVFRAVRTHDLVFCWFASWHSFLPALFARLLRKPSIVVIGGYDLANLPAIGYGHQRGGARKWVSRGVMRLATRLMTFSYYSQREAHINAGLDSTQVEVIYLGFSIPERPLSLAREDLVITAANVDRINLRRKGLLPFVQAAALLPHVQFALIGAWRDKAIEHLRAIATPNVCFTGYVSDDRLADYLNRAKVYVQASMHEGFGMAVAEAMLAGCIPVVTRAGALPEVVGDAGIYVDEPSPAAIAEGIRAAFRADDDLRRRARERIAREFPLEKRRQGLFALVESVWSGKTPIAQCVQ